MAKAEGSLTTCGAIAENPIAGAAKGQQKKGAYPRLGGAPEARRKAAVVLEVLAGELLPAQAAEALGIGLPRYYLLEQRALAGLVEGCEPKEQKGRVRSPAREIEVLRQENARLRREAARQQALVRLAQRAIGLSQAAGKAKESGKEQGEGRKRRRRPVVRALKAAKVLQEGVAQTPGASDGDREEGGSGPAAAGGGAGG